MPSSDTPAGGATLSWAGDRFMRVALGSVPCDATGLRVRAAARALSAAGIPALLDVTPAYTTLLLAFDALALVPDAAEHAVQTALSAANQLPALSDTTLIEVPVCYDACHGPDLPALAAAHGLTPAEVTALHSAADYRVAFIGFTPGFPYLTGLPEQLATPRLPSPRPRIDTGSVGIAGMQTGIYPGGTPGGWRLIGRTPLRVFDPERERPALLAHGDRVRFRPIST
ncbi:MAG: 5-oxoprolinase subunit PxpB, partial [Phycisphaerales bacterium]|nr:5-oxoprolinase subunit PxpB [Phycisphaerales bacterium]